MSHCRILCSLAPLFEKGSRRGLLLFLNNPAARFNRGTHGSDGAAVLGRRQFDGALHILRREALSFKHEFDEDLGVALRMIISPLPADVYLKSRHIGTLLSHDRDDVHSGATRYPHENHFHGSGPVLPSGLSRMTLGLLPAWPTNCIFSFHSSFALMVKFVSPCFALVLSYSLPEEKTSGRAASA